MKMTTMQKMGRLLKLIVHLACLRIKVTYAALFFFDGKARAYVLRVKKGRFESHKHLKVGATSPLVKWMKGAGKAVIKRAGLSSSLKGQLDELGACVCVPYLTRKKLLGFLMLGKKLSGGIYTKEDIRHLSSLPDEIAVAFESVALHEDLSLKMKEIKALYEKDKKVFLSTISAFAAAIDAKDPYTHGHTKRVTGYCLLIRRELERFGYSFDKEFDKVMQVAALMHDVGKIGTPDDILNKRGPLTKQEYEEIKKHPLIGASILNPIDELRDAAEAIKHHQERWDGGGYPDGLTGNRIPLISRIVMVADAFDAMVSDRPYRQGVFDEIALEEIRRGSGTQFDPTIATAFIHAYRVKGAAEYPQSISDLA